MATAMVAPDTSSSGRRPARSITNSDSSVHTCIILLHHKLFYKLKT